ncbi:MAG: copper chaperone PCu(A)C [Hyphomonadaceae bacterium]
MTIITEARARSAALALGALILSALAGCGPAAQTQATAESAELAQTIRVADGWIPVPPNGARVAAGYLTVQNEGATGDRLLAIATPRAGRTEIHEMRMDGDMMVMQAVDGVDAPAGGTITLAPGGLHIMFHDMAAPFREGERVPIALTFRDAGQIEAELIVRARTNDQPGHGH